MSKNKTNTKNQKRTVSLSEELEPVNPEIFEFVLTTYNYAASFKMPVENPSARAIDIDGKQFSLADNPMMRGAIAAKEQLVQTNAKNHLAYMSRIFSFGQIIESKDRFGGHIRVGETPDDAIIISKFVMHAAATAKMVEIKGSVYFDIDDVINRVNEYVTSVKKN
jgi:hypothetical protein